MIVIGSDPHKTNFSFAAVEAVTGELRSSEAVKASAAEFDRVLQWARKLDEQRVWAIEDCRHVSGRLERFLLARGERIVRVSPKLMAGARQSARSRGKSDQIDAIAVARAALREGVEMLPAGQLEGPELDVRLLVDHHDDQVAIRTAKQGRLRWHLHDLECPIEVPTGGLDRDVWLDRLGRWLSRQPQDARVRIARTLVVEIRAITREVRQLQRDLEALVAGLAPQLLAERGCGPLTAAKLLGEIAGAQRFATDAKLARTAGVAPIPASSGRSDRHRLDRGGNRQLNCALHRLAVNKGRWDPESADYLARKQAEGKTRMEALRCLKRHLARRVWHLLTQPTPNPASALDTALALT
ncbi:MAG: IS110 family transposase [Actinomycetota bacterium]|nr:IS110 family transposase [Actinomycetota bacterium]